MIQQREALTTVVRYTNTPVLVQVSEYINTRRDHPDTDSVIVDVLGLRLGCLTPLSTIFQLYRGSRFIGGGNRIESPEKTTNLSQGISVAPT